MKVLFDKFSGGFFRLLLINILFGTLAIFNGSSFSQVQIRGGYYPPFIKAAEQGDISQAEILLKQGAMVNQTTIGNQTALHLAATTGEDKMVIWLLAHEANPLAKGLNGNTPADFAKQRGNTKTEKLILDYIQLVISEGQAITAGDYATLRKLLMQDPRKYTILHVVVQLGVVPEIKKEIRSGTNINAKTSVGLTPLHKSYHSRKILRLQSFFLKLGQM